MRAAGGGGHAVKLVAFETDQSYVDLRHISSEQQESTVPDRTNKRLGSLMEAV